MSKENARFKINEHNVYDEALREAREAREYDSAVRDEQKSKEPLSDLLKEWSSSDAEDANENAFAKRMKRLKKTPPNVNRSDSLILEKSVNSAPGTSSKHIPCVRYNKGICELDKDSCIFNHVQKDVRFTKTPPRRTSTPKPKTYSNCKIWGD